MRQIFTLFLVCFVFAAHSSAQRRVLRSAEAHIANERYVEALNALQPLLEADETPAEAHLFAGIAHLNRPGGVVEAEKYLDLAVAGLPLGEKPSRRALEAQYYKAQVLHLTHRFEEALSLHQHLLEILPASSRDLRGAIEREIGYAQNAIEMVAHPVPYEIQNLGAAFNTTYDEHSPIVALDESTLYFTSNRPADIEGRMEGHTFEDIYVSHWREGAWTNAQLVNLPGNYYANRATVALSADGNTLVFYQNDATVGNLYYTRLRFGQWTEPQPFPAPINTSANETHASFSLDGDRIYFTSDRAGGYGGRDIYVSHLLPDGNWGEPLNMGPNINTPLDEHSPYLHPDGQTLYFSSEGHHSMGGLDVFFSMQDEEGNWGEPVNMGYPVNSPDDDVFFMPTPDGNRVYYASRQTDGLGGVDLYLMTFPSDDDRGLAVTAGFVFDQEKKVQGSAIIRVYDEETDLLQGVYRPNTLSGKFVAVLPAGQNYRLEVEAEGFETHRENFRVEVRDVFSTRGRAHFLESIFLQPLAEEDIKEEMELE